MTIFNQTGREAPSSGIAERLLAEDKIHRIILFPACAPHLSEDEIETVGRKIREDWDGDSAASDQSSGE